MSSARLGGLLVGDAARHDAQGRDAAGVDDALDPGVERGQHQIPRAVDIGAEHRPGVGHPQPVIGRDVEQVAATRDRRGERVGVFERAFRDLDLEILRGCGDRCWARASTRTGWPALSSARATAEPTNPVAPVTRHKPEGSDIALQALISSIA